ncbi:carbohydrate ABC transporter permease [Streptomyces sp. WMMB 322]|uniref:carbohydrate ABC transporter permease n=1 Tax=Streptomyces sp. WMMB 322 TaxID=1286821 RepID=UPI000823E37D|nr:carbohydrate ABC transporter permease [Streptomyces sp. WMMB 322]SCK46650.1 carbohydrate ABC transporter membrane protein 2, CUT1 family [Streptomyces sp. WMMB 322]
MTVPLRAPRSSSAPRSVRHRPHSRERVSKVLRLAVLSAGALVLIAPFLYMAGTSFKPHAYLLEVPPRLIPEDPTTANYSTALSSNNFGRYFLNSMYVAASTTFAVLVLASTMAYAFARFDFRGKRILFAALLGGLMIPGIVTIVPQFVLASSLGLLNSLNGLVLFYSGSAVAFITFLLRAFFERVPQALDDAMTVDGAGPVRKFVSLYLPMVRPALATAAIFAFLGAWDEFVWALTVIDDPDKRTLPIAIAAFQGQHATQWGLVFAASVIAILPVLAVYVVGQRQFIAGIASGAVKD